MKRTLGMLVFVFGPLFGSIAVFGCGDDPVVPPPPSPEDTVPKPPAPVSQLWKLPAKYLTSHIAVNETVVFVSGDEVKDTVSQATYGTIFVAGVDQNTGKVMWLTETDKRPWTEICGLASTANAVYVGRISDTHPASGRHEVYVDKLDAESGDVLWSTLVIADERCYDIAVDEANVYLVTLPYVFKLAFENGVVVRVLDTDSIGGIITWAYSIAVDKNSAYIGGETTRDLVNQRPDGAGGTDFFVVSYDKDFRNKRWLAQWGDSLYQWALDVAVLPEADLVGLIGYSSELGSPKSFPILLAYNRATGQLQWTTANLSGGSNPPYLFGNDSALYAAFGAYSEGPVKVRSDGSINWVASPPSAATAVAERNGTVFAVNETNRIFRYDAATGAMKQ